PVERRLGQDLVAPVVESVSGRQFHRQQAAPAAWPCPITQPSHRQGAGTPSCFPGGNKVIPLQLFNGLLWYQRRTKRWESVRVSRFWPASAPASRPGKSWPATSRSTPPSMA